MNYSRFMLLLLLTCGSYSLNAVRYVDTAETEYYGDDNEDTEQTEVYYYNDQPYNLPVGFWGWGYGAQAAWWGAAYPGIAFGGWGSGWRRGGYGRGYGHGGHHGDHRGNHHNNSGHHGNRGGGGHHSGSHTGGRHSGGGSHGGGHRSGRGGGGHHSGGGHHGGHGRR